ncbi:MAG TPA: hypothetical protein VNX29_04805 [Kaistia sp.]|nr:hypothetical protein [Kaistia sp.]
MISMFTVFYAVLALCGGALGAYLTKAPLGVGLIAAAAGFIASCVAQLAGSTVLIAFAAFVVVTVAVALVLKLRPAQIGAIIVAMVVVSMAGQFAIGFVGGFDAAFSKAFNHALHRSA